MELPPAFAHAPERRLVPEAAGGGGGRRSGVGGGSSSSHSSSTRSGGGGWRDAYESVTVTEVVAAAARHGAAVCGSQVQLFVRVASRRLVECRLEVQDADLGVTERAIAPILRVDTAALGAFDAAEGTVWHVFGSLDVIPSPASATGTIREVCAGSEGGQQPFHTTATAIPPPLLAVPAAPPAAGAQCCRHGHCAGAEGTGAVPPRTVGAGPAAALHHHCCSTTAAGFRRRGNVTTQQVNDSRWELRHCAAGTAASSGS